MWQKKETLLPRTLKGKREDITVHPAQEQPGGGRGDKFRNERGKVPNGKKSPQMGGEKWRRFFKGESPPMVGRKKSI